MDSQQEQTQGPRPLSRPASLAAAPDETLPADAGAPADAPADSAIAPDTEAAAAAVAPDAGDAPSQPVFRAGTLSCAGLDWLEIPRSVAIAHGPLTTRLDLCFNNLETLRNLDQFTALEELILDNNSLGDHGEIPSLPRLHTLTLNKNCITNLDALLDNIKRSLPNLTYLSLLGNAACPNELVNKDEDDYTRYRLLVISQCPKLKFLDSRAVSAAEAKEAKRVGEYTRVVRPSDSDVEAQVRQAAGSAAGSGPSFSPLPQSTRSAEDHRGTIGVMRHVYHGKHSEGNRFIRNDDL